jgi:hypothetical protein
MGKKDTGYLEEMKEDAMEPVAAGGAVITQDGDDLIVDLSGKLGVDEDFDASEHDANLAEGMDQNRRLTLGQQMKDWVTEDEDSRSQWYARIKSGLEIIGVEEIPTENSAFDGSATVNHPAIAEAMTRFQANAMEEVFPAEGPVKAMVIGESTPEREDQATRVAEFMNYQLTDADDEYFEHTDQMLMYLPYSGSAFKKVYHDMTEEHSVSRFVTAENFIVPYDATSLKTAPRYTHKYTLYGHEINARINSGEFLDTDALDTTGSSGKVTGMANSVEGRLADISDDRTPFRAEEDIVYDILEIHAEVVMEEFDKPEGEDNRVALPYVFTIEAESGEILACRRLWKENDKKRKKRVHFIHYKFLPGLGFYGWGYLHIIGSLGKAASGALRALLDGAATASLQGGFKSKESKLSGEFVFTPGVWKDVDMTAEDLAKSFYTPPFKEPSPALFHTLEMLVQGIQAFSSTTEAMTGAADNKGPVGTTMALIEQGSKVYSGIHKRIHKAAKFEFKLLAELNYEHMDDEYPYEVVGGDRSVLREDFDGRVDIIPVSDPNIHSNVQRVAQAQATLELINTNPELYDDEAKRQAHLDMHKALRTPNPERLLPKRRTKRLDPVTENQIILTGGAVEAFPEQDHASHIQAHTLFMQEVAGMGLDEQVVAAGMVNMSAHLAQHHAHAYKLRMEQELGEKLPNADFKNVRDEKDMDIETDNAIARAIAENVAPPPPPQGPEPSDEEKAQAAHEQKLKHNEEVHAQKMQQREDEHAVNMKIKDEMADQDLENKDEAAERDRRKKAADNMLDTAARAAKVGA